MNAVNTGISIKVRIIHMFLFELFGIIIFAPFAALVLAENILTVGTLGIVISLIAMVYVGVMLPQNMVRPRHCTTVGSGGVTWEYSRGSWQDWRQRPLTTRPFQLMRLI